MSIGLSTGTSIVATATAAGGSTDAASFDAQLALHLNVAAGLASNVASALDDVLGKGADNADAASFLRLHAMTSALDVSTDTADALIKANADKKKRLAQEL